MKLSFRVLGLGGLISIFGVATSMAFEHKIDFDESYVDLYPDAVDDDYENFFGAGLGVHFDAFQLGKPYFSIYEKDLVIFDTNNPTGGDGDLITPGYGSGNEAADWGSEGYIFAEPNPAVNGAGNVLIIQESDSSAGAPDDDRRGGLVRVRFDVPVTFNALGLLDIDRKEIAVYHGNGGQWYEQWGLKLGAGDNTYLERSNIGWDNVTELYIKFTGSGALTGLQFTSAVPEPATVLGSLFGLSMIGYVGLRRRKAAKTLES